jgi:ribokinase
MPKVCVVGSANMDLIFRVPRLPRPGETLIGHSFSQAFGGKGANQAVAAARLGASVSFLSRVGPDAFGDAIRSHLREEGVDVDQLRTDPEHATSVAGIMVDDSARNSIVAAAGASQALSPADVERAADVIRGSEVLVCQMEVPREAVLAALAIARAAGVHTVFNPAPALPVPDELWGLVDVCVPNEVEAELLTGYGIQGVQDAAAAGWELTKRGPATVVVTLGDKGAMIVTAGRAEHLPAFAVRAVDSTGAGDAFVGGLATFLAEGGELREAVRRASAVAALSTTRLGAQAGLPTRGELNEFLSNERDASGRPG